MQPYWAALDVARQVAAELALPQPTSFVGDNTAQSSQILAMLNSAGNELLFYYPWQQFVEQLEFATVDGQEAYDLPQNWAYFVDQTQWDRTNHWPLLGPKSPQEWAWLKGGLLAQAPRLRYRVMLDKMYLHPVPGTTPFTLAMEYIRDTWAYNTATDTYKTMVNDDGDTVLYDPWLMVKYIKLKFYELKGMPTDGVLSDFLRIFNALTGKDRGAPKLSLSPRFPPIFIGPWSIPDGSWDVTSGTP